MRKNILRKVASIFIIGSMILPTQISAFAGQVSELEKEKIIDVLHSIEPSKDDFGILKTCR